MKMFTNRSGLSLFVKPFAVNSASMAFKILLLSRSEISTLSTHDLKKASDLYFVKSTFLSKSVATLTEEQEATAKRKSRGNNLIVFIAVYFNTYC